jgi:phosphatidylglycerophosphatase A
VVWALAAQYIPIEQQMWAAVGISVLAIAIGIPAAHRVARESGQLDPGKVVVDEVAGQMIAVIAAPLHWKYLLLGFILFRAFDITKPPPLRRLEKLHGGAGIVMDDVAAGVYSLIVLQLVLHFGIL